MLFRSDISLLSVDLVHNSSLRVCVCVCVSDAVIFPFVLFLPKSNQTFDEGLSEPKPLVFSAMMQCMMAWPGAN